MKPDSQLVLAIVLVTASLNLWAEEPLPAECANAEAEIAKLNEQKQSTGSLLTKTPIGFIAKEATETKEDERKEKEIKAQNKAIDEQIDALKEKCNIE